MRTFLRFEFRGAAAFACALLFVAGCTPKNTQPQQAVQNRVLAAPTVATVVAETDDGQWTMPAKNYASTRYSGLEDINTGNAAGLKLAWSFYTGLVG